MTSLIHRAITRGIPPGTPAHLAEKYAVGNGILLLALMLSTVCTIALAVLTAGNRGMGFSRTQAWAALWVCSSAKRQVSVLMT